MYIVKIFVYANYMSIFNKNMLVTKEQLFAKEIENKITETEKIIRNYDEKIIKKINYLKKIQSDLIQKNQKYKESKNAKLREIYEIINQL